MTAAAELGLDIEYIHGLGAYAARFLRGGLTVILGFEPGNMTHYDLALVPLCGAYHLTSHRKPSAGIAFPTGGQAGRPNYVLVGWGEHAFYPFELLGHEPRHVGAGAPIIHPGYIAGKLGFNADADGVAFAELFHAIATEDAKIATTGIGPLDGVDASLATEGVPS